MFAASLPQCSSFVLPDSLEAGNWEDVLIPSLGWIASIEVWMLLTSLLRLLFSRSLSFKSIEIKPSWETYFPPSQKILIYSNIWSMEADIMKRVWWWDIPSSKAQFSQQVCKFLEWGKNFFLMHMPICRSVELGELPTVCRKMFTVVRVSERDQHGTA